MRSITLILTLLIGMSTSAQQKKYSYLALGDSYTIGESVPVYDNFPYQLVQALRVKGIAFYAPEIVAKTGWTTDELQAGINKTSFLSSYDLVTLLIGVNNQYRGRSIDQYEKDFEQLIKQAIQFAHNKPANVVVVSIPDWGATPFAKDRDRVKISKEIDAFNAVNKRISAHYNVKYADITVGSRKAITDPSLVANDGLHPSGSEYAKWVQKILSELSF